MMAEPESEMDFDQGMESQEFVQSNLEIAESSPELFIPLVIITAILGGLTIFYLWKSFKK